VGVYEKKEWAEKETTNLTFEVPQVAITIILEFLWKFSLECCKEPYDVKETKKYPQNVV
jgi:hypothetical protein